jgi:hypothetical protein
MRCYICNKRLKTDEILVDRSGSYAPCAECTSVARDLNALPVIVSDDEILNYLVLNDPQVIEEDDDGLLTGE